MCCGSEDQATHVHGKLRLNWLTFIHAMNVTEATGTWTSSSQLHYLPSLAALLCPRMSSMRAGEKRAGLQGGMFWPFSMSESHA